MDLHRQINVVVCGGRKEFEQWCMENNCKPHDLFVRYATATRFLRGLKNCKVVYYGNYWNNKLFGHHILDEIQRS